MNIPQFIADLQTAGISLSITADGQRIAVDSTNGELTEEQKSLIRQNKSEIMDILRKPKRTVDFDSELDEPIVEYI